MIDIDPELVLKSPWLWDEKTIAWAQALVDLRASAGKPAPPGCKDLFDRIDFLASPGTAAEKTENPK